MKKFSEKNPADYLPYPVYVYREPSALARVEYGPCVAMQPSIISRWAHGFELQTFL